MTTAYHDEHLLDRAAMLVMRGMIALQPKIDFETDARPGFDALMEKSRRPMASPTRRRQSAELPDGGVVRLIQLPPRQYSIYMGAPM